MSSEISAAPKKLRIPEAVDGIQVNFCKNPTCLNFGRPASNEPQPKGSLTPSSRSRDTYLVSGAASAKMIVCKLCNEHPSIKSNLGISEELERITDYLLVRPKPSCPNLSCVNHDNNINTPKAYKKNGISKGGSQRYCCLRCGTTFSVATSSVRRQQKPEINENIFKLLINKMPLKRICETADITISTLYGKIDFIHQQCLAFVADHERLIPELSLKRLYLSVDRQEYTINWKQANDKRNIVLQALGCADNSSSYVFGMQVNYDASLDPLTVNREAFECGDLSADPAYRRFARLWLYQDYVLTGPERSKSKKILGEAIRDTYEEAIGRPDIEEYDGPTLEKCLPQQGMQVHAEYTLYGYFFFLKNLLRNVEKVRFYLDQESGIRAACLSAFCQEVLEKRCDAFYVRIDKELTINEKRKLKADSLQQLEELRDSDPALEMLSDNDLRLLVIKERLGELVKIGRWQDRWMFYPFPDMSEPRKAICWLTDLEDRAYDADHQARLYSKATLHGIDRFFMQVRRRISLLERPIHSASSTRKWYGYSPYNPEIVGKMLDIFRVFYNYVELGEDKKTPAIRIGLANTQTTHADILGYQST